MRKEFYQRTLGFVNLYAKNKILVFGVSAWWEPWRRKWRSMQMILSEQFYLPMCTFDKSVRNKLNKIRNAGRMYFA